VSALPRFRLCYAPGDQWPHPAHTWYGAPPEAGTGDPVVLVAYVCRGGWA
jgi:hypothetical protein